MSKHNGSFILYNKTKQSALCYLSTQKISGFTVRKGKMKSLSWEKFHHEPCISRSALAWKLPLFTTTGIKNRAIMFSEQQPSRAQTAWNTSLSHYIQRDCLHPAADSVVSSLRSVSSDHLSPRQLLYGFFFPPCFNNLKNLKLSPTADIHSCTMRRLIKAKHHLWQGWRFNSHWRRRYYG